MVIQVGDKVHVMTRRQFEYDIRRHFVGEVVQVAGGLCRLCGYTYVHQPTTNDFVRRPEKRLRILDLGDSAHVVNVLPAETDLDAVQYRTSHERRLVVTDGKTFCLDINEFSAVA